MRTVVNLRRLFREIVFWECVSYIHKLISSWWFSLNIFRLNNFQVDVLAQIEKGAEKKYISFEAATTKTQMNENCAECESLFKKFQEGVQ